MPHQLRLIIVGEGASAARNQEGLLMQQQADDAYAVEYITPDQPGGIPGWHKGIPVIRLFTCGLFAIEILQEVPGGDVAQARYEALSAERLRGAGPAPACHLLKLLVSQAERYASKDWLMTHLREGKSEQECITPRRLENIVSSLRKLLILPGGKRLLDVLTYERATHESGDGYRLAGYPLVWVDADALAWNVKQACLKHRFGDDPFPYWQRAYELASRGSFLLAEPNSEWARKRRKEVQDHLRQSVHALARLYLSRYGEAAEEEVLQMLSAYRRSHPIDEDLLRPFLQLLTKRGRYGEVLDHYEALEKGLAARGLTRDGKERTPHQLTQEIVDYARLKLREGRQVLSPIEADNELRQKMSNQKISLEGLLMQSESGSPLSAPFSLPFLQKEQLVITPTEKVSAAIPSSSQPREIDIITTEIISRQVSPYYWGIPYQRNPFFIGREDVLAYLCEVLLANHHSTPVKQYALCGLGGIGKTQIVLEYAYRYSHEYQAIFWVKADTRENLLTDFLALAQLLKLAERDAQDPTVTVTAIKEWLRQRERWLLILDNADDLALVPEFLPGMHQGHILLTTRAQATGRLAHRIEVEQLDQDVGALFLLRRSGIIHPNATLADASEGDRTLARACVTELGGLPLALDQAGAYIEEASLSLEEYSNLYRQQKYVLLKRRGGLVTDHPEPVATTWSLAFQQVEDLDLVAADILRMCAFLDPDAIAEEIFTQGAAHVCFAFTSLSADPTRLYRAIEVLRKFSLIQRNSETKILTIHRLLQASVQGAMDQEAQCSWAKLSIQAVSAAFPDEVTVAHWPLCQRLLPHVQASVMLTETYHLHLPEAAHLFNQAGYYLRERALYQEAESLYKKAFSIRERILGPAHPDTAQVLYNLARLYYDLGQYDLCERLHLQSLEIREQAIPADHLALALSLNSLAFLYYIQERNLDEAERLYQRALTLFDASIGMDHPKTAHCLSNLALLYVSQGKGIKAEQLLLRVRAIREMSLGPMHLDTARSLQNLAWFYIDQRKQERYAEAKQLLEQSRDIRKTLLGPEHPQVAMSLHHLALLCEAQGNDGEALHLYQQVLTIRRKMMGCNNPKVLLTEAAYATLLRKMGKEEEATQLEEHIQAVRSSA
jgi:tetratricopeptide (TPR) repeat protein